jgi:hypothetical protein
MGLSDVPADRLLAWVEASTRAQGLPLKVTDPATVDRVRSLLTGGEARSRASARSVRAGPGGRGSEPPDRLDAGDVETFAAGDRGGMDDHVVKDGLDDRHLAGEVEVGPPVS